MLEKSRLLFKAFLLRTFDVRVGEYHRVMLMQLNIFLLIFTLSIIKPVVNAQFISIIGVDKLPLVFLLVAISAMGVSFLYTRALNSRSLKRVTSSSLLITIFLLTLVAILLHLNLFENLILYLLYIGIAIFGVLATSQFWIMANLAFDAREAKRLFSFLGAGPIAGGIAGGYITSVIANYIDGINLLFLGALLLCICLPINRIIWRHHVPTLTTFQRKKRLKGLDNHPFWLIRQSKHLTYLALIIGIGVFVSKLVEFQFSSVAVMSYEDPDELTSFFGFWLSTFNVISLMIQLFITRRIVGTYGVGSSLFILPGGILLGSSVLLLWPTLWAGVFTKLWEVSVKQSVNKSATELLALPIPAQIKSQTKSFIDVFVDLAATGLAGLMLIFLINGLDLSIRSVSILTLMILFVWVWIAIRVRKEYLNSFKSKLTQADKKASQLPIDYSNISVINGLKRALHSGTDLQIIYVLDKVEEIPDKRLFDNVIQFLDHKSPQVRMHALQCIYFLGKEVDSAILERLLMDADQEVRYKAFAQLFRQTKDQRISLINKYLTHSDPVISGAALVGVAEEARNNEEMKRILKVEQRIHEKIDYVELIDDPEEKFLFRLMILRAAGQANIPAFYPIISGFLHDKDMRLVNEAILAAGFTMNIEFVEPLTKFLVRKETRTNTQKALLFYGMGIIPVLDEITRKETTSSEVAQFIPGILEQIDAYDSVKVLLGFLNMNDVNLRLESLRSLNTLQRHFPHLSINKKDILDHVIEECNIYKNILGVFYKQQQLLPGNESAEVKEARIQLTSLLERRLDGTLERIFRLLGLRYPPDDVISAYEGIKSINESVRLNSVEYLDNLLEPTLRRALMPIAENAFLDTITKDMINNLKVKIPDEKSCLQMLLQGRDVKLKLAVFKLIEAIGSKDYLSLVKPFLKSPNEKVRKQALTILQ